MPLDGIDLFTVALHEIGHAIGWTQAGMFSNPLIIRDDLPFGGTTIPTDTASGGHIAPFTFPNALMDPISQNNQRVLISDIDLLGMAQIVGDGVEFDDTIIHIPAGQTSASKRIESIDDLVNEIDEPVRIDITNAVNAVELGEQFVTTTILDDDTGAPGVALSASAISIDESGATATITATLSNVTTQPVIIGLDFTGTADASSDYSASDTEITIPVGSRIGSVTITGLLDMIDELDETVAIEIATLAGAVPFGDQAVEVTIIDDDPEPSVSLSIDNVEINEPDGSSILTATFVVNLWPRCQLGPQLFRVRRFHG